MKRVGKDTRKAIVAERIGQHTTLQGLADKYGISIRTVRKIIRESGEEPLSPLRPVSLREFRVGKPYYCPRCEAIVSVRPCPACAARRAKKNGVKPATAEVVHVYQKSTTPRVNTAPHKDRNWIEIPPSLGAWIFDRLSHMIGEQGRYEEVEEATETLADQIRSLIAARARSIGEERRTGHLSLAMRLLNTRHQ